MNARCLLCRIRFEGFLWMSVLVGTGLVVCAADRPDLTESLRALPSRPGAILEVPDGIHFTKGHLTLRDLRGTEENPIVIRAANRSKAVIAGVTGFVLKDCEHVVIEGFVFENDADQPCVRLENCQRVRVTRNIFRPKERAKPRRWEHWVTVEGARSGHNRIDHNRFERKVNRGSPLFVRGDDAALVCSQHDRIDHNHFRDVVYADGENGHETLRTGGNDLGAAGRSSFTVIEHNLLEHCSGEDEIMSLKSSDNIVRHNTLINCRGAICLRLGNRTEVTGNIILATEPGPGFGGIKLYGFEHRVTDNYLSGLTGTRHEAPLALVPGMYATPTTDQIGKAYDDKTSVPPTHCIVARNTWVDCAPLQFGFEKAEEKRGHPPSGCRFTENRIVRTQPDPKARPLVNLGIVRDLQAKGNLAYDAGAHSNAAWAAWFRWDATPRVPNQPKALKPSEVGPEAP